MKLKKILCVVAAAAFALPLAACGNTDNVKPDEPNNSAAVSLQMLVGKRVGVIGMGNVPDLTLRMLLDNANIEYVTSDTAVAGKVALRYADDGGTLMPLMKQGIVDYGVLAEPAVTTAEKNIGKVVIADIQQLWRDAFGGDYPQACLVAKNTLIQNNKQYVDSFLTALKASDGWAEEHPDEALAAVSSHMQSGTATTLTALSSGIVARCNIETTSAADARSACDVYFTKLAQMRDDKLGTPVLSAVPGDAFYYNGVGGNGGDTGTVHVYMPDGAPAVALSALMHSGYADTEFTVVPALTIAAQVSSGAADMAIMPINAAATLFNRGVGITMLSVNTHGNLYIMGDSTELSE